MNEFYFAVQVLLAVVFGGLLGWQRGRRGKSAGIRTYALVAAGSALFTILSLNAFGGGETSRVAAQIVTGIGFLGAGLILHRENRVEGLTTAAGLWMAAAVGMAVGVRFYMLAAITTLVSLFLLFLNDDRFQEVSDEKKD